MPSSRPRKFKDAPARPNYWKRPKSNMRNSNRTIVVWNIIYLRDLWNKCHWAPAVLALDLRRGIRVKSTWDRRATRRMPSEIRLWSTTSISGKPKFQSRRWFTPSSRKNIQNHEMFDLIFWRKIMLIWRNWIRAHFRWRIGRGRKWHLYRRKSVFWGRRAYCQIVWCWHQSRRWNYLRYSKERYPKLQHFRVTWSNSRSHWWRNMWIPATGSAPTQ